jgi:hypothetical protein
MLKAHQSGPEAPSGDEQLIGYVILDQSTL